MTYRRVWTGDEWQQFAHRLVQLRHGPANVQCVPDTVKGDAGIEFFTLDGTLYQCYAPEETTDLAKAAAAQKAKAQRDLRKLSKHKDTIQGIVAGIRMQRWILLCPFLDNKDVITSVRAKAAGVRKLSLPFLAPTFDSLVHSQADFSGEIEKLRQSASMPLKLTMTQAPDITEKQDGEIGKRLTEKLNRGLGGALKPDEIAKRRDQYILNHSRRENALEELLRDHPELWERARSEGDDGLLEGNIHGSGQYLKQTLASVRASVHRPDRPPDG